VTAFEPEATQVLPGSRPRTRPRSRVRTQRPPVRTEPARWVWARTEGTSLLVAGDPDHNRSDALAGEPPTLRPDWRRARRAVRHRHRRLHGRRSGAAFGIRRRAVRVCGRVVTHLPINRSSDSQGPARRRRDGAASHEEHAQADDARRFGLLQR
jgi:hypothetical protein